MRTYRRRRYVVWSGSSTLATCSLIRILDVHVMEESAFEKTKPLIRLRKCWLKSRSFSAWSLKSLFAKGDKVLHGSRQGKSHLCASELFALFLHSYFLLYVFRCNVSQIRLRTLWGIKIIFWILSCIRIKGVVSTPLILMQLKFYRTRVKLFNTPPLHPK